jgi:hypothetical protein
MSDQSLRDALEVLAADRESPNGAVPNDYVIAPYEIRDLLAAHPVEPAASDYSQEEIAAKVADRVPHADMDGFTLSERLRIGKAVAPLFSELLGPRPLLDREAVFRRLHEASMCACNGTVEWAADSEPHRKHIERYNQLTDAVVEMARPMPTREQLFQYLHEVTGCICDLTEDSDWARGHRQVWYERTDKLLALLNGTEA